jgi:hypothetical protein
MPGPYTLNSRKLKTPFAWGDASRTEEIAFLRDGRAFWPYHPCTLALTDGNHSRIVRGAAGSGRSALAQMLPLEGVNDAFDLFVYIKPEASWDALLSATAEQLFTFVLRHPRLVSGYQPEQQQKVAQFLAKWLAPDKLTASAQSQLTAIRQSADALKGQAQGDANAAYEALKRFLQLQGKTPAASYPTLDVTNWPYAFLESARILGFKHVIFVMALDKSHYPWLIGSGNFADLYDQNIHFWLFVDDDFPDWVPVPQGMTDLRLAWTEEQARLMLSYRFEKYLDAARLPKPKRGDALVNCFDQGQEGLQRLLQASMKGGEYNPRLFMTRWRDAVGEKEVGQKITVADLERAIRIGGNT